MRISPETVEEELEAEVAEAIPLDNLVARLPMGGNKDADEEEEEAEEAMVQTIKSCSGWSVTLGDDLADCRKDMIIGGVVLCCSPLNKERTEAICLKLTSGQTIVDWYWLKGRIIVKTNLTDNTPEIAALRWAFELKIREAYHERLKDDAILEKRAQQHGHRFEWSSIDAGGPPPKGANKAR